MTTSTKIIGSAIEGIYTAPLPLKEWMSFACDRAEINARVQDVLSYLEQ